MLRTPLWLVSLPVLILGGCKRAGEKAPAASSSAGVVGRYSGGFVTAEELRQEIRKMPSDLQDAVRGKGGQRELVKSIIDKRLLFEESKRRGLTEDPAVRRQVQELEERLSIQMLLALEERNAGGPNEAELRDYYQSHARELTEPERLRLFRVLVKVPASAKPAERARAKDRIGKLLSKLRAGESFEKVAAAGDGPERARRGEWGFFSPGDIHDPALAKAAVALKKPNSLSQAVECDEGYAVLLLRERQPGRLPSFDESRARVEGLLSPTRKRKTFDELIARLRRSADVHVDASALR